MQIIDILLLLSTFCALLFAFTSPKPLQRSSLYLALFFLLAHLIFSVIRWQFYPIYAVLLFAVIAIFIGSKGKRIRYTLLSFGLLATLLSAVVAWAFPMFELPQPSGEYTIGLETIYLEDTNRLETITAIEDDYRKFTAQIWYPSDQNIEQPEAYLDEGYAAAFAKSKGFPSFVVSHFHQIPTHTQKALPVVNNDFPILILSHGYGWNAEEYTSIIEELVSQGYIVFGVEHSYENPMTVFKDETFYTPPSLFKYMNLSLDFNRIDSLTKAFQTTTIDSIKLNQVKAIIDETPTFTESMNRWSDDIIFLMDQLIKYNFDDTHFLYQRLDLDRIGLLGHSWGGAVVAQTAAVDHRVDAVINLDGGQFGELIDMTLDKPFLAMYADRDYNAFFTPNFFVYDQVAKGKFYQAIIKDTGHANFGDLSYWSNLNALTETGAIAPERMTHITNELILRFFDLYLNDKKGNFTNYFEEGFPEVGLKKLN